MADTASRSETSVTVEVTAAPSISLESVPTVPVLRLKLKKPKKKKVGWTTDTVDNEHLNKKKSKCCCIYEKPHKFGESSSESDSDDSCDQCRGHTDKEKKDTAGDANEMTSTPPAPSASTDS